MGGYMNLYEKIKAIYPELRYIDFQTSIRLQNDWDEKGDYIAKWDHPLLPKPTQEQLDSLN